MVDTIVNAFHAAVTLVGVLGALMTWRRVERGKRSYELIYQACRLRQQLRAERQAPTGHPVLATATGEQPTPEHRLYKILAALDAAAAQVEVTRKHRRAERIRSAVDKIIDHAEQYLHARRARAIRADKEIWPASWSREKVETLLDSYAAIGESDPFDNALEEMVEEIKRSVR